MRVLCSERFIVTYRLGVDTYEEAKALAWAVQIEQTIEFPYELVQSQEIKDQVVGQLVSLEAVDKGYLAKISYGVECSAFEVTQFMNVVFGNSSLQPNIWVEDIELPESLKRHFGGPRFGLAGVRKLCQVPTRPMIQAVIKPMGVTVGQLEHMCRAYTQGGVDVIKDDHGITNQPFSSFEERIKRCASAVQEENAKRGTHTLYAANVSGDGMDVWERAHRAKELGATALMVAPGLIGFGWLNTLAKAESLQLPIIVHPSLSGGYVLPGVSGISMNVWLGLLPRLFGGDMDIFVTYGGRFTFTTEACKGLHDKLSQPWTGIKAACPSPGGGVTAKRLPELMELYGKDTMFLVGGDMFRRGPDLQDNMKYFISLLEDYDRVHKAE